MVPEFPVEGVLPTAPIAPVLVFPQKERLSAATGKDPVDVQEVPLYVLEVVVLDGAIPPAASPAV